MGNKFFRQKTITSALKMLEIIKEYQIKNGFNPNFRELKKEMGLSSTCLVEIKMNYLKSVGLITSEGFRWRAINNFAAPAPEPAVALSQQWLADRLSEAENNRDEEWLVDEKYLKDGKEQK
jgi:hypothetical protein